MSSRPESPDLFDFALSPLPPFPEDELDDPLEINVHNVGFYTRQARALEECRQEEAIRVRRISIFDLQAPIQLRTDLVLFRQLADAVDSRAADPNLQPFLSSPIQPTYHNSTDGLGYKPPPPQNYFGRQNLSPHLTYIARNPISIVSPSSSTSSVLYENSSFSHVPLPSDSDSILPIPLSFKDFMSGNYSAGSIKVPRARSTHREPPYQKPCQKSFFSKPSQKPFYQILADMPPMVPQNPWPIPSLLAIDTCTLIQTPQFVLRVVGNMSLGIAQSCHRNASPAKRATGGTFVLGVIANAFTTTMSIKIKYFYFLFNSNSFSCFLQLSILFLLNIKK